MPRPSFVTPQEFIKWVNARNPKKYECYLTVEKEFILVPTVSTRPVVYGSYRAHSAEDVTAVQNAIEAAGIPVFLTSNFEWRDDVMPKV
jgi:hypothetical protein